MPHSHNALITEEIMPMQIVDTIASLPWAEPEVPESVSSMVFYGPVLDLDKKIRLEPSGKSYAAIPFEESSEEMMDLLEVANPRIIHLSKIYSKFTNTSKDYGKVRKRVYQAMLKMLEELPDGVGIAFRQGYRSIEDQKALFDRVFQEILATTDDPKEAYQEACKYVAPVVGHVPAASTGAVVEMTLFYKKENGELELMDLGTMGHKSYQCEAFSNRAIQEQRKNRLILFKAAAAAGFANYGMAWWQFSMGDKVWAYVYDMPAYVFGSKDKSLYSSVDEYIKRNELIDEKIEVAATAPKTDLDSEAVLDKLEEIVSDELNQDEAKVKAGPDTTNPDQIKPESKRAPKEYMTLVSVTDAAQFDKLLQENPRNIVLVKFFATWCGPCNRIKDKYIELAKESRDVLFLEVDVDKLPVLADRFKVALKPTFIFLYEGKSILTMVGSNMDELIKSLNLLREVLKNEPEDAPMEDNSISDEALDLSQAAPQITNTEEA